MAIFVSNASGAICWPNLQPIQVHGSTEVNFKLFQLKNLLKLWTQHSGTVVPLAIFLYGKPNINAFYLPLPSSPCAPCNFCNPCPPGPPRFPLNLQNTKHRYGIH